jgi:hypothetical protein
MKYLWFVVFCYFSFSSLHAYEWPIHNSSIIYHFGELTRNYDGVNKGIIIHTPNNEVYNSETGMMIFEQSNSQRFLPSKKGVNLVLLHKDDMYTIYSQIKEHFLLPFISVDPLVKIGNINEESHSFKFILYDKTMNQYVNPLLFLNITNYKNNFNPTLSDFLLEIDNQLINATQIQSLKPGKIKLFIKTSKAGIYSTSLSYMGNPVSNILFDTFGANYGSALLRPGNINESSLYPHDNNLLNLGEILLIPGKVIISITISHINGKTSNRNIIISVKS